MEKFASQRYTSKSVVHGLRVISGPVAASAEPSGGGRAEESAGLPAGSRQHGLQALASEWLLNLKVEGRSPRTLHWYRQQVRMYLDRGGATTLEALTGGELKRYICTLQDRGLSDNTVRGAFLTLRSMCNWAAREGYAVDPSLLRIRTPRVSEKELVTYSETQVREILAQIGKGWSPVAVRILLGTGVRISELCDLRLDDFEDDGEAAFLKVRRGKGAKFRRVPVSSRLRRDVLRWINRDRPETKSEYLLAGEGGRPVSVGAVTQMLKRLSARAEVGVHAHGFRHTFATEYVRNGGSIERLRKILGHSSYQMVLRYVHLHKGDLSRDFDERTPY